MRRSEKWTVLVLAVIVLVVCASCGSKDCANYEGMYENHEQGRWFVLETDSYELLVETGPKMSGQIDTAERGKLEMLGGCEFRYTSGADGLARTFTIEGTKLIHKHPADGTTTVYVKVR
jgi:hypothetical protein